MRSFWLLFAAGIVLYSCQKDTGNDPNPSLAAETRLNIAYGTDPLQKMDAYLPAERTMASTKVIILIHGGGWNQGDKADFTPFVDTLKKRLPGYAIFNINYRLATGTVNFFPVQENDVKAAVEFIYSKRGDYQISEKFVLLGASAGGHLSLLHAYKYTSPVKIKAVVDFFGPTDLADMYNNPPNPLIPGLLVQVTGGTPATHASIYQASSPVNYVTAESPPTIILHGTADIVVSISQSNLLLTKLLQFGHSPEYSFYSGQGHGFTGPYLIDAFDRITAFLNANVN